MVFCEGIYLSNMPIFGVVEFINSLTSIFLILFSMIPIYVDFGKTIQIKRSSLFLCGIGSIMYHATMENRWKLFDEIPMIIISTFSILNLVGLIRFNLIKQILIYTITFYFFFTIWFDVIGTYEEKKETGEKQIYTLLFRILFVLPFVFLLIFYVLYYCKNYKKILESEKKLYKLTLITGLFACICWLVDMHYCNYTVSLFRLHGFWHIFVGFTGYNLICLGILLKNAGIDVIWYYKFLPILRKSMETELISEVVV